MIGDDSPWRKKKVKPGEVFRIEMSYGEITGIISAANNSVLDIEPFSAAASAGIAGLQLIQTSVSNLPLDFAGLIFQVDNETQNNFKLEAYDNIHGNVKESPTDIKAKSKMQIAILAK